MYNNKLLKLTDLKTDYTTYSQKKGMDVFRETIDYIFVSHNFSIIDYDILLKTKKLSPNKINPSDHNPLYIKLKYWFLLPNMKISFKKMYIYIYMNFYQNQYLKIKKQYNRTKHFGGAEAKSEEKSEERKLLYIGIGSFPHIEEHVSQLFFYCIEIG